MCVWVYICIRYVTARKHERERDREREKKKTAEAYSYHPAKEIFPFLFYFIPKIPRNTNGRIAEGISPKMPFGLHYPSRANRASTAHASSLAVRGERYGMKREPPRLAL